MTGMVAIVDGSYQALGLRLSTLCRSLAGNRELYLRWPSDKICVKVSIVVVQSVLTIEAAEEDERNANC